MKRCIECIFTRDEVLLSNDGKLSYVCKHKKSEYYNTVVGAIHKCDYFEPSVEEE